MVADHAIMRDVRVGQQDVVVAEDGPLAFLGAEVDADVFAESIAGPDLKAGFAWFGLQVLRAATNEGVWKHLALRAELRVALDGSVVVQNAAVAKGDVSAHVGVGTDDDVQAELGAGFDDRSRVDLRGNPVQPLGESAMVKSSSAEETHSPLTKHSHSAAAIRPRTFVSLARISRV